MFLFVCFTVLGIEPGALHIYIQLYPQSNSFKEILFWNLDTLTPSGGVNESELPRTHLERSRIREVLPKHI